MRQHTEVMRGFAALGVEVVDVAGSSGRGERRCHLVGVLRTRETGLCRADAGHVLDREDQHLAADVVVHPVGEVLAGHLARSALAPAEPHLDLVAGLGAGDRTAQLGVVVVVGVAVPLTALPLLDPCRVGLTAVDGIVHLHIAQGTPRDRGNRLLGAV